MAASTYIEPAWQPISRRKQAQRDSQIPSAWRLPSHLLPHDPPSPSQGAQSVLSIPSTSGILSQDEISITESYTIPSLLRALSSQSLTSTVVTTAFCKRAALAQQLTNCLTEPLFTSALSRAQFLDQYMQTHKRPLGPLHGLPVSMKDTFNIAGVDTSIGLASLCFKPAAANAPLTDLLLSLGCVIIAKTNVPQTLGALDSNNNVFGRTMNPLSRLCTAGGSSGGEGVLVAMKGCMVGWGTDVGGSIRVPAMCNGVYGFKPSQGRVPYDGQAMTSRDGMSRVGVQAVAGPIGRSVEDIELVMNEVMSRAEMWGRDCLPAASVGTTSKVRSGKHGEFVVGVLRSDGNCQILPPIQNMLDDVAALLKNTGVQVVELSTPAAWTKCQGLMSKVMGIDGGTYMADLLEATGECLVPWMKGRFRRGKARSLPEVADLQSRRAELEREMLHLWYEEDANGAKSRKVDAIICPLAAHPVPEIDRYNAVGYTSSWVLLDYPAGTVPVRAVVESDLELGKPLGGRVLGSWDERNRELWDEQRTDRKVYLGTPLSVQIVVPKLQDTQLVEAMKIVDHAVRTKAEGAPRKVKL